MTLQQLEYFRVLARVQHYTKASEILLISQPSLSYSISQLEKELGVPLFQKEGKKIKLSHYGEHFLSYAEKSLDLLYEGKRSLKALVDPETVKVNLGFIYSISSNFIPQMINEFYKEPSNRKIKFNFVQNLSDCLITDLKNGKLDLLIIAKPDKGLSYVQIFRQKLVLIASKNHPFSSKKNISISELNGVPFVLLNKNSALRQMCDDMFENLNIKPNVVFEAEECNAVISFVSLNFGVSIIPEKLAKNENISEIKISDESLNRPIYMCWNKDKKMDSTLNAVFNFIMDNYSLNK
ncbi:LysR family transcriptional regulator [Sedimentibacter sp.]|uniref:LysR family transcriptional regulator n=1 Tax=Sedimentibacter sp. TaxID=1960295 RepID=UPI0028A83E38|nr:LysR family transcriptional regulator [Sedimentibacter sp.]